MEQVNQILDKQEGHTDSPVEKVFTTERKEDLGQIEDTLDKQKIDEMRGAVQADEPRTQTRFDSQVEAPGDVLEEDTRTEASPKAASRQDDTSTTEANSEQENKSASPTGRLLQNIHTGIHLVARTIRPKHTSVLSLPLRVTSDALEGTATLLGSSHRIKTAFHLASAALAYPLKLGRDFKRPKPSPAH